MALIVVLENISSLAPVSDYNYQVLVGDGTSPGSRTIASGQVIGHIRDEGWQALVQRVLNQEAKEAEGGGT
jgi:hypothetical protein